MKRTDYETLAMEEIVVEMENGFLAASGDELKEKVKIVTEEHEAGETFDLSKSGWE